MDFLITVCWHGDMAQVFIMAFFSKYFEQELWRQPHSFRFAPRATSGGFVHIEGSELCGWYWLIVGSWAAATACSTCVWSSLLIVVATSHRGVHPWSLRSLILPTIVTPICHILIRGFYDDHEPSIKARSNHPFLRRSRGLDSLGFTVMDGLFRTCTWPCLQDPIVLWTVVICLPGLRFRWCNSNGLVIFSGLRFHL